MKKNAGLNQKFSGNFCINPTCVFVVDYVTENFSSVAHVSVGCQDFVEGARQHRHCVIQVRRMNADLQNMLTLSITFEGQSMSDLCKAVFAWQLCGVERWVRAEGTGSLCEAFVVLV